MPLETIGEMFNAAQACRTKEEALRFMATHVDEILAANPDMIPEQARALFRENVGYMTGYCSRNEAARLLALFDARHPVFGAIEEWPRTPEETIELGFKMGQQARKRATG